MKSKTTGSPVQLFGELDFGKEYFGDFYGVYEGASKNFTDALQGVLKNIPYGEKISNFVNNVQIEINGIESLNDSVDSRDVNLHYLYNRVMKFGGE